MNFSSKDKNRFNEKIHVTPGCWIWVGSKNQQAYGSFRIGKKIFRAHRASYLMHIGNIDDGLLVCHKCDNPSCVNPDHLFLGTSKENADDRDRKGRNINYKGEQHGSSKLTEKEVIAIKFMHGKQRDIAKIFGIHQGTVHLIKTGKIWKHIDYSSHELAMLATAVKLHPKVKA